MEQATLLTTMGSDRATAYNTSAKMVRRGDRLFVTWLDAPRNIGSPTVAMLGLVDLNTASLLNAFPLGGGIDNHCGAALALDGTGRHLANWM